MAINCGFGGHGTEKFALLFYIPIAEFGDKITAMHQDVFLVVFLAVEGEGIFELAKLAPRVRIIQLLKPKLVLAGGTRGNTGDRVGTLDAFFAIATSILLVAVFLISLRIDGSVNLFDQLRFDILVSDRSCDRSESEYFVRFYCKFKINVGNSMLR